MSLFQLAQGPGFSWEVPYALTPSQPFVELAQGAMLYEELGAVATAFRGLQWERSAHNCYQQALSCAQQPDYTHLVVGGLSEAARCWGYAASEWQCLLDYDRQYGPALSAETRAVVTRAQAQAQQLAAQLRELLVTCCRCYGVSLPVGEEGV